MYYFGARRVEKMKDITTRSFEYILKIVENHMKKYKLMD